MVAVRGIYFILFYFNIVYTELLVTFAQNLIYLFQPRYSNLMKALGMLIMEFTSSGERQKSDL